MHGRKNGFQCQFLFSFAVITLKCFLINLMEWAYNWVRWIWRMKHCVGCDSWRVYWVYVFQKGVYSEHCHFLISNTNQQAKIAPKNQLMPLTAISSTYAKVAQKYKNHWIHSCCCSMFMNMKMLQIFHNRKKSLI